MSRRTEFIGKNLRPPTPAEEQELRALEREDQQKAEGERRESELKRAYLNANPGASEADWSREKGAILAADRQARTVRERDAARAANASRYRL